MRVFRPEELRSGINLVPLVDITLVLLIIFMVTTPLMRRGYELAIPKKVDSETGAAPTDQLILSVQRDGRVLLNEHEVPAEELEALVATRLRGRAEKVVFFRAHRDLPYQQVIHIMDAIRAAGGLVGLV